jgi:RNA polymerase sigma factor (sigma-70 family)
MNMNLAEQYMPLANSMACRMSKRLPFDVTLDDLKSAAFYALAEAASRYDPSFGVSFPSYARARISGEMFDCLRRSSPRMPEFEDCESRHEQSRVETDDFFDFLCSELGEEDGKSLRMYYVDGRSLGEVGRARGVSESRACQIIKECHSKIRRSIKRRSCR